MEKIDRILERFADWATRTPPFSWAVAVFEAIKS